MFFRSFDVGKWYLLTLTSARVLGVYFEVLVVAVCIFFMLKYQNDTVARLAFKTNSLKQEWPSLMPSKIESRAHF